MQTFLYRSAFSMDSSILIEIFYWIYIISQGIMIYKLFFYNFPMVIE